MKKLLSIFVSLVVLGGNGVLAQSLKKQNQQLKTQNTILTDSIQKLNTSLDSVAQLKTKLTADYEKLKAQYGKSGTKADSLFKVCQLQASEIYALQVTNDSLSSRIQKLLAERSSLQYQTDSLLALQERKLEEKKQKELWDRRAWFNVAYSPQKINSDLYRPELKADYAVGITWGRSYYLHKKPLANMVRFALNWSFFDLNIAQYSALYSSRVDEGDDDLSSGGLASASYYPSARTDDFTGNEGDDYWEEDYEEVASNQYKMEVGMQIGPAVIVNPISHLMIQAYFHYAPTYSILLDEDMNYYGGYASFFNTGVALSYKAIGLGIEARWGNTTYSQEVYNAAIDDYEYQDMNWKTKGMRVYLSFRF